MDGDDRSQFVSPLDRHTPNIGTNAVIQLEKQINAFVEMLSQNGLKLWEPKLDESEEALWREVSTGPIRSLICESAAFFLGAFVSQIRTEFLQPFEQHLRTAQDAGIGIADNRMIQAALQFLGLSTNLPRQLESVTTALNHCFAATTMAECPQVVLPGKKWKWGSVVSTGGLLPAGVSLQVPHSELHKLQTSARNCVTMIATFEIRRELKDYNKLLQTVQSPEAEQAFAQVLDSAPSLAEGLQLVSCSPGLEALSLQTSLAVGKALGACMALLGPLFGFTEDESISQEIEFVILPSILILTATLLLQEIHEVSSSAF